MSETRFSPYAISFLPGKCATQNSKNAQMYAIPVYGLVDILWTYRGGKIKRMIFPCCVNLSLAL